MPNGRQRAILQIIRSEPVHSQDQIVRRLLSMGLKGDQPTVSKDLKVLGIVKRVTPDGRERYFVPDEAPEPPRKASLARILRQDVKRFDIGQGALLIRTKGGDPQRLALALEELGIPGVAGTLAGRDGVLVLVAPGFDAAKVAEAIRAC